MTPFPLKIVTPDGLIFDGQAEELIVRTTTGDMGILAGHSNCVAPLSAGRCMVMAEGKKHRAQCAEGMVSVTDGRVTLICAGFIWEDESSNI